MYIDDIVNRYFDSTRTVFKYQQYTGINMERTKMSRKTLQVAFVGAGAINFGGSEGPWDHATRLEQLGGVEFIGIVDPLVDKAQSVLEKRKTGSCRHMYAKCDIFSTVDDFLKSKRPDAVLIGIPPVYRGSLDKNKDVEIKFIKAGVHCFIEKPLSVVQPEQFGAYCDALVKVQQEKGVIASVGYMFRYHAAVCKMQELIKAHGGPVMAWNGRYHFAYSEADHAFWWNKSQSGGPIVEQATHFIDLARFLVGEVDTESIQTMVIPASDDDGPGHLGSITPGVEQGLTPENRVPRVTSSMWKFTNGGIGSLMHTIALHGRRYESHVEVIMDGLRLTLYEPYHPECKLLVRDSKTGSQYEKVYEFGSADPYREELKVFLEAINSQDDSHVRSSYQDAAKSYSLSWAIRKKGEM